MSQCQKGKTPSYRLHKQSGQAIVTLTDLMGIRKDYLLGKYDFPLENNLDCGKPAGENKASEKVWFHAAKGMELRDMAQRVEMIMRKLGQRPQQVEIAAR